MTKEQFQELHSVQADIGEVISEKDMRNKSDRTLLLGITKHDGVQHVYMKNNKIKTVDYRINAKNNEYFAVGLKEKEIKKNQDYISSRLIPHVCDFEFCTLLKRKGIDELQLHTRDFSRELSCFFV